MEYTLIFSFLGASILLALMPGPDNIFVLTESITRGSRNGIATSVGLSLGVLVHTTAAATGLSLLLYQSAIAFQVIKFLGAAYLIFLAIKSIQEKTGAMDLATAKTHYISSWKLVRKGFIMNVLNPKVSLFFIAFLPQFVTKGETSIMVQMMVLGMLFMLVSLTTFTILSIVSGKLHPVLRKPKFQITTKWVKALVMGGLGISLAFSKK